MGHFITAQHFGLTPTLREREVLLNTDTLPLKEYLTILVAGAVNEHGHFPESLLMNGCGGDATLICQELHGTNPVAYATALACIVEGSNAQLCIPKADEQLIREAVHKAQTILETSRALISVE